jgi:hypothetical protein
VNSKRDGDLIRGSSIIDISTSRKDTQSPEEGDSDTIGNKKIRKNEGHKLFLSKIICCHVF